MQSFRNKIGLVSGGVIPAALTMLMLLLGAALSRIPGFGQVMPLFTLINIYYWGTFYPGVLPYWFLFVLGILQDTLAGQPLGFSSFVNIMFAWVLAGRLRVLAPPSFAMVWLKFTVSVAGAILLEWGMMDIYYGRVLPVSVPALRWLSTCIAYPPVHFFLTFICGKAKGSR